MKTEKQQLQDFIISGAVGTMRQTIGESKWWYTYSPGDGASITEKVSGETVTALYNEGRMECLQVLNGTYEWL